MISSSALSAARASATTLRVRYVPTGQRLACQRHNREMRYLISMTPVPTSIARVFAAIVDSSGIGEAAWVAK